MLATLLLAGVLDAPIAAPTLPAADPPASRTLELTGAGAPAVTWRKYGAEVLDYRIGFAGRLDGDTIRSVTVVATGGLIVSGKTSDDEVVTFWLSGGVGPAFAGVAAIAVTAGGRTLEGKATVQVLA